MKNKYKLNTKNISYPLTKIAGIGDSLERKLLNLDIRSLIDLLYHFPSSYQDSSQTKKISELKAEDTNFTLNIKLEKFADIRLKGGRTMQRANATDESGTIELLWFNQPFLKNLSGRYLHISGKVTKRKNKLQIINPTYEYSEQKSIHTGRIIPFYPLTGGITQKRIRKIIKNALEINKRQNLIQDPLSETITNQFELISLEKALTNIHFPKDLNSQNRAKYRLAFDELLNIQLNLEKTRLIRKQFRSPSIKFSAKHINKFLRNLPFTPTNDQRTSIETILKDIKGTSPMYRLLQGDVGSGKTLVAIASAYKTTLSGKHAVVMAPTTVLAEQLHTNFNNILSGFNTNIHLITSSTKNIDKPQVKTDQITLDKPKKLNKTNNTVGDIYIGTHALLYQQERFKDNLGILVIDEQHRFGVEQRNALIQKTDSHPHVLLMSATPIPRTLAVSIFGDIDISIITEKPKGRKPTKTYYVSEQKREDFYKWIQQKVEKGEQVFWICPLIENSENLKHKSIDETHEELIKKYPTLKIKKLHGRMKNLEKNSLLKDFKEKKFDILLSTTVIEVGIDIPNANTIVIESSERFGLATLHQLRGRVGRGEEESFCLLFTSNNIDNTSQVEKRLKYFSSEHDGLKIAEYDLKNRGPGEVYGIRQSGVPNLKIASLTDLALIKKTNTAAKLLLKNE